ncbi:hypothetical protein [Paenibacillus polymyxa]|uniref:hypothetical protein n=1 Tax=Paenibacillus polymyxa TaxID=1406 RepID=UPI001CC24DF9|nr:hypothetical protein [Paenibacillus polymyxa]
MKSIPKMRGYRLPGKVPFLPLLKQILTLNGMKYHLRILIIATLLPTSTFSAGGEDWTLQ